MAMAYPPGTRAPGTSGTAGTKKSSLKPQRPSTPKHKRAGVEIVEDAEDDMAGSFLHFCAMCENQITMPTSTLYCSEACRSKDAHTQHLTTSTPPSPLAPTRDIVPQRSPTLRNPSSFQGAFQPPPSRRPRASPADAARYLAQFSSASVPEREMPREVPSLSHSVASSQASTVSHAEHASHASYTEHSEQPREKQTHKPTRPILAPQASYMSFPKRKSIDLVTPLSALHVGPHGYGYGHGHGYGFGEGSLGSEGTVTPG